MIGIPTEKKIDSTIDHPRVLDEHIDYRSEHRDAWHG
jgi:hypothetical protein